MIAIRCAVALMALSSGYAICQNSVQQNVDAAVSRSVDQSSYRYYFASTDAVLSQSIRRSRQNTSPSALTRSGLQSQPNMQNLLPPPSEVTSAEAKLSSRSVPIFPLVPPADSGTLSATSSHRLSLELPATQPKAIANRRSGTVIQHFGPKGHQQEKQEMSWRMTHSSETKHTPCCQ